MHRWGYRLSASIVGLAVTTGASAAQVGVLQTARPADVRVADSLFTAQRYDAALQAYEALTKAEPAVGRHWYRLGLVDYQLQRIPDAAVAFERSAVIGQNPTAQYNAGAMHARLGHADTAFAWLQRAMPSGAFSPEQLDQDTDLEPIRKDARYVALRATAHAALNPCEVDTNSRRLDFWIGSWDVKTVAGQPAGSSVVEKVSGGCALYENWTDPRGATGKSLNAFNRTLGKWQQFWAGQGGGVTEYRDSFWRDSSLVYQADGMNATGQPFKQRMTFTPKPGGIVRQFGEISTDNGATWTPTFELFYHPKR